MLVLSRKKGEEIIINGNIYINILDIKKDHIKIGISAPINVSVHRREVYELIKDMNIASAELSTEDIHNLLGKKSKETR
ncbi:carbon storage regulator CsrA [Candidatus Desantisbacteria bacterium]|nr:carbon storage regulator CsrA [Candidatus Desantisbacteria bacterium]